MLILLYFVKICGRSFYLGDRLSLKNDSARKTPRCSHVDRNESSLMSSESDLLVRIVIDVDQCVFSVQCLWLIEAKSDVQME